MRKRSKGVIFRELGLFQYFYKKEVKIDADGGKNYLT